MGSVSTKRSPRAQEDVRALLSLMQMEARRVLECALDKEAGAFVKSLKHLRARDGRRLIVRNGNKPPREVKTLVGPVSVQQPRVHVRDPLREDLRFRSQLIPPYARRTKGGPGSLSIPRLLESFQKGCLATLAAVLGRACGDLPPVVVKACRESDHEFGRTGSARALTAADYARFWAGELEHRKRPLLVLVGTRLPPSHPRAHAKVDVLAFRAHAINVQREWLRILRAQRKAGLDLALAPVEGRAALQFWGARDLFRAESGPRS